MSCCVGQQCGVQVNHTLGHLAIDLESEVKEMTRTEEKKLLPLLT